MVVTSVCDVSEKGDEYEKKESVYEDEGDGFVRCRFVFMIGMEAPSGRRRRRGEKL